MRIGIGHPGARELVNGYVLHDFAKADQDWLRPAARGDRRELRRCSPAATTSSFMNRVHLATTGEEEQGGEAGSRELRPTLLPRSRTAKPRGKRASAAPSLA